MLLQNCPGRKEVKELSKILHNLFWRWRRWEGSNHLLDGSPFRGTAGRTALNSASSTVAANVAWNTGLHLMWWVMSECKVWCPSIHHTKCQLSWSHGWAALVVFILWPCSFHGPPKWSHRESRTCSVGHPLSFWLLHPKDNYNWAWVAFFPCETFWVKNKIINDIKKRHIRT